MHFDAKDLQAVARLWRELAAFPLANAREARLHCLAGLAQIIGAQNAFWVAAVRDPQPRDGDELGGWRPRAHTRLRANPAYDRRFEDIVRSMRTDGSDPMTIANVARAGATRAALRRELVSDADWERAPLVHEVMRPAGVEDRMMGVHALDAGRESYFGFDRGKSDRPFAERERDLLHLFLLGAPEFHRGQFLVEGLDGPPLTPRERQVLALLLTDRSEREIGQSLGITSRTTHQYCVSIFRKFDVKGRLGLMALFLAGGRRGPDESPC